MKRLKRRISAAFKGNSSPNGGSDIIPGKESHYRMDKLLIIVGDIRHQATLISVPYRNWSLSDSMSQLADRSVSFLLHSIITLVQSSQIDLVHFIRAFLVLP